MRDDTVAVGGVTMMLQSRARQWLWCRSLQGVTCCDMTVSLGGCGTPFLPLCGLQTFCFVCSDPASYSNSKVVTYVAYDFYVVYA